MPHWVKFLLSAVIETATKGKETFEGILKLRQEVSVIILAYGKRAKNAQLLLNFLYKSPSTTINNAASLLGVSHQAASALINKMLGDEILVEFTGYQRNKVFIFSRYISLFKN
jgi:Fic family protein